MEPHAQLDQKRQERLIEYIKQNPDLGHAVKLLLRDIRVSKADLQIEFGWTEWKARKVYSELRALCMKGVVLKTEGGKPVTCIARQGYVQLVPLKEPKANPVKG